MCNKETNECCSEELNHCCPSGKTAYFAPWHANDCCTGEVYCAMNDATGNCYSPYVWYCCAPGKKIIPLPVRSDGMQGFACCADDETPYYYRGSSACCSGTLSPGTGPSGEDECLQ